MRSNGQALVSRRKSAPDGAGAAGEERVRVRVNRGHRGSDGRNSPRNYASKSGRVKVRVKAAREKNHGGRLGEKKFQCRGAARPPAAFPWREVVAAVITCIRSTSCGRAPAHGICLVIRTDNEANTRPLFAARYSCFVVAMTLADRIYQHIGRNRRPNTTLYST